VDRTSRQLSPLQIESELLYFRKHYGVRGVLACVCLALFGAVVKACSGLLRHRDPARAAAALRHSSTNIRILLSTRLASRATR
jgi:hypothetical protein